MPTRSGATSSSPRQRSPGFLAACSCASWRTTGSSRPRCCPVPGSGEQRALDEHELYFKHEDRRTDSDRDYLLHVFEHLRGLPAAAELFDPKHNPLWAVGPTGDGATELLRFWQRVDPDTGALVHDFTDPDWNTRFLGDLYQDLSEGARKKYALLQTPEFVEEFILDRTLTPAIEAFGFQEVRLIDPTCGSGHFLLGAFHRLFELWVAHEPGTNPRALAQRALDQVFGVDLNPYAVAIARFRLLVAALRASGVHSIRREEAPAFHVNVAAGDSLLHGRRFDQLDLGSGGGSARRAGRDRACLLRRGPGGAGPHPRAAVPRRGRQSAVHHGQGQGAESALPGALQDLPPQVLAGGAVHRAVLPARA